MHVVINYGTDKLTLRLPDSAELSEYGQSASAGAVDEAEFIQAVGIAEPDLFPIGTADLFVVNDAYRPTPTEQILKWLLSEGKLNVKAKFLIATGCHQRPDDRQLRKIFGEFIDKMSDRLFIHDAKDRNSMIEVGTDRTGEKVLINRHFYESERVVVIGSIEPHYFAGFTGGRKSIFPGLCDYETTVRNHNMGISFDAAPVKLAGNPVHEHLQFLMTLVSEKKIFGIQIVCGYEGIANAIECGQLDSAFYRAAKLSRRLFEMVVANKYDLILAEVRPPLDSNLYQLQKSLENCQSAVQDGGMVILFSPCHEGIGSDAFYKLADRWNKDGNIRAHANDSFGVHKLHRVNKIGERINVYLHSELDEGIPDKVFFKSALEPQEMIDKLMKKDDELNIAIVRDAGHTVLTIK